MTNIKTTKRALLGSIVSLVLCFSMLLGTTYAWFTDSAATGINTIIAGNLDVKLEYATWDSATGDWTDYTEVLKNVSVFNENALWEPGYTEVVKFRVTNAGTLAFMYQFGMDVYSETGSTNVANVEFKLSDFIRVGSTNVDSVTDRNAAAQYATKNIHDAKILNVVNVFGTEIPANFLYPQNSPEGKADENNYYSEWVFVVHMPVTVGNEANHKTGVAAPKITFGVNLLATQSTYEKDSFGDQYDKDANSANYLTTSTEVYNSTLQSGKYILAADINTSDSDKHYNGNREYAIRDGVDYTLNLNGHTLNHDGKNTGYTYLYTSAYNGKLTINGNGTINSANSEGNACIFYAQSTGEIEINGGKFNVDKGIAVWAGNGSKITINGGSFISTGSAGDEELIYSSGGVIDIYGGFFHNKEWEERPVNVFNDYRETGFINIYGGTFVNFDPSTGGDDPNNIKVADGYKVVSETQANGDVWYTVIPE